ETTMTISAEHTLVAHLADLQRRQISPTTRARLAQALLDWFTAGWSAAGTPAAARYRRVALDCQPGAGPAPVFGGPALNANGAAFANAAI
ncbi:hypothetical protein, partial [Campylobacter coli]|uniref:hypothetical protein n=1 Tax=Campylobacter coli TaxID=195 RepID=UPI001F08D739